MKGRVVVLTILTACGGSSAMRAAVRGDFPALRAELVAEESAGTISNHAAAGIARAVAERSILEEPKEHALARVREVRACAFELDDALARRMKTEDEAGAEAAESRLSAGTLDADDVRAFASSADPAWRAVGVRGLTREKDRPQRLRAVTDPDPRVRRAAIRAMFVVRDTRDLDVLFDAARLDPEPFVRMDAVRAMGAFPPPRHVEVANRLRDLWVVADDGLREDIAAAWASPLVFVSGGREALRLLLAAEHGPGVLAAAGAILRAHLDEPELEASARTVLARAVESSSRRDRLHAIAIAPIPPPASPNAALLDALRKAAHDPDAEVRVAALARLTEVSASRDEARSDLEGLASRKDRPEIASRARLVLATGGDLRIQAWIEADLSSADAVRRLAAVDELGALGMVGRGAPVLADPDPSVRTRAACAVLLAAAQRR